MTKKAFLGDSSEGRSVWGRGVRVRGKGGEGKGEGEGEGEGEG